MAEVNLTINGRTYGIACDDGQEDRVIALGRYVDERLKAIGRAGAASNESHLLVLATIVLADEIFDLRETAKSSKANGASVRTDSAMDDETVIVSIIDQLSSRIDSIAGQLQKAL